MTSFSVRHVIGCAMTLTALTGSLAFAQGVPPPIPRTNWTLLWVDSEDTIAGDYAATNAFDGDPASMWSTEWLAAAPPPPHELQIDLGDVYDVSGFRHLPRQDGQSQGRIGQYQFYVSMDGANWGTAVASQTLADVDFEQQVLFSVKRGRYILLRAMTEADGKPWTTVAELNVLGTSAAPGAPSELPIPQTSWTVHLVDSQETNVGDYTAPNAFDGNSESMWVTQWWSTSPPVPHELQINLGAVYDINGFRYLPRQDGSQHGRIGQYQFYVSMDGSNWGSPVASGTFPNSAAEQQRLFTTKRGQFVGLRAVTEVNGRPWTTVAELNVLATGGPIGGPPSLPGPPLPRRAVFTPSPDHSTLVNTYVLQIFRSGSGSSPIASLDLGKPAIVNGECQADVSALIAGLTPGTYFGTVSAVGNGGMATSAPSPAFNR